MKDKRDDIRLWKDKAFQGEMEVLRASCFDHRYPPHFHDEFVMAIFARGAQRNRVCRKTGVAAAGTVMFIHPGEVHTGEAVERDLGWDYCAFYPSEALVHDIADAVLPGKGQVNFGREIMYHAPEMAEELLQSASVLAHSRDAMEKECALFQLLSTLIARYGERSGCERGRNQGRADMRRAVEYLQAHYHQPVSVLDVARAVGLSEFHFMRLFQSSTGLSVHRFLTQIRLIRAKSLLARGVSASQTAQDVGFFDQSHFSRTFRIHFGVTPGAFAAACR
ncbi:AraC family transcriptional regulator [Yokenella regensburgei]|uniref:helix-turn-helix transcriptional regulator n=1 Tax=Yokenella regensburgei TaxID=158877 RepID=UPI003F1536D3